MTQATCEQVRDELPDALAGRLPAERARELLAHLRQCPECAAEAELVRLLRLEVPVPAGLEARVRAAAAGPAPAQRSWSYTRPALLAATVAAALLGGTLLLRQREARAPATPVAVRTPAEAGAAALDGQALLQPLPGTAEGSLYSGATTLDDLSEEELQTLLKEL